MYSFSQPENSIQNIQNNQIYQLQTNRSKVKCTRADQTILLINLKFIQLPIFKGFIILNLNI